MSSSSSSSCSEGSPPPSPVASPRATNENSTWIKVPLPSRVVRLGTEADSAFSVAREFNNSVVLLTGATGYIGSLLLELILRLSPDVRKVYVLIRNKKGVQAEHRLDGLLSGPVFCRHNTEALQSKLEVVHADIAEPQCGLSDTECVSLRNVNYVIHCAAAIRFDMHIHDILRQTFAPTDTLLSLASKMPELRCFTFISTAFVNANLPKGSAVQERLYPFHSASREDGPDLARRLLQLPRECAQSEAEQLMEMNGLQNTYFLAKNLTERLVAAADNNPHRVCILRPSIVGCVSRAPYPGFVGNSSGFTAAILGASAGIVTFAQHNPSSILTIVPSDMVAATTLVATAAHGRAAVANQPSPCTTIVHACTSATYPVTTQRLYLLCCTYLNEDPPLSGGVRRDYKVEWVQGSLAFWLRCLLHSLMILAAALTLRLNGQTRMAQRLSLAWEKWHELASKRFDFNLTFQNAAAQKLETMLSPRERNILKVTWREEAGDSWLRYLRSYVAGVKHLYRNEAPTIYDTQDYRPYTKQ